MARVESLFVAAGAGEPTRALGRAGVAAGVGLDGDRYALGRGHYSGDDRVSRDLTLVEGEVLDDVGVAPAESRRNVVTRGIRLNDLVGEHFRVGDVVCRGTGLCEPCRYLEELAGRPLLRALVHRGGLRADVLTGGAIAVGDEIEQAELLEGVGAVVVRDDRLLLGRRLSAHGRGTWSFPGGKPLDGEAPEECARRELLEETGLRARNAVALGETVDRFPESGLVYRTTLVRLDWAGGEPVRREPDKADDWGWHCLEALPQPLFAPVASFLRRSPA